MASSSVWLNLKVALCPALSFIPLKLVLTAERQIASSLASLETKKVSKIIASRRVILAIDQLARVTRCFYLDIWLCLHRWSANVATVRTAQVKIEYIEKIFLVCVLTDIRMESRFYSISCLMPTFLSEPVLKSESNVTCESQLPAWELFLRARLLLSYFLFRSASSLETRENDHQVSGCLSVIESTNACGIRFIITWSVHISARLLWPWKYEFPSNQL